MLTHFKKNALYLAITCALLTPAGLLEAGTLVNNSGQTLQISNGLLTAPSASPTSLAPGASFAIPSHWGDAQQVYLYIRLNGQVVCDSKYGVTKLPAAENQQVTAQLTCITATGPTPSPTPTPTPTPSPNTGVRTYGNGTWLYDAQFLNGPTGPAYTKGGLWATKINTYNEAARSASKLNQLFTYGGDLEAYCRGSGGSLAGEACTSKNMMVFYYPPSFYNTNITLAQLGDSGFYSTVAYSTATQAAFSRTQTKVQFFPIIDGRVDSPASSDYLNAFNKMTTQEAQLFADNVARVYCADNQVAGLQFDVEPFTYSNAGQKAFYDEIAKNVSGNNKDSSGADRFHCKNAEHPNGRSFSIFTFPANVTLTTVQMMDRYQNGYAIYSLYDLPEDAAVGPVNTPSEYYNLVRTQLSKAIASGAYFQVGIPAAASVHEYEAFNGQSTGFTQLDYVKSAIKAINDSGVRSNPKFLGIDLWGWSTYMSYPPHSNNVYTPNSPPTNVLQYLQQNL